LGARKLKVLTAEDVDKWLAGKAKVLSTSTLRRIRSILAQSITRAHARDKVTRIGHWRFHSGQRKVPLTMLVRGTFQVVRDTGIEPVTSSVSGLIRRIA
jgi:hypothetical protein